MVAGRQDVGDLVTHVMDAARRILVEKALDRRAFAQGMQQLDLGVLQFHEHHGDAVVRLRLWR